MSLKDKMAVRLVARPAIATRSFRSLSPDRLVDLASRMRAEGIEWSQTHVPLRDVGAARRIRDDARNHGLDVIGYAAYWPGGEESLSDIVSTAVLLGAPTIRLGVAALAGVAARDQLAVGRALDTVAVTGLTVSLWYLPTHYEATLRFVRQINHPALRVYWRARHGWRGADAGSPLQGMRFCVSNLPLSDFIRLDGTRLTESDLRLRVLGGPQGASRYAIFDAAQHGASLERASKMGCWL